MRNYEGLSVAWNLKSLEEHLLIGSTLVEGSTLTESEAKNILAGKTIQGHPVHEVREILNYRMAVEGFMQQVSVIPFLSRELIWEFHTKLFYGLSNTIGRWKTQQNFTYHSDGTRHDYLSVAKVDAAMAKWCNDFNIPSQYNEKKQAAELATKLYYEFQEIHPFEDGNGRIGRVLVAYWLHWKAKFFFTFHLKDKIAHLNALERANKGNLKPLIQFFEKRIIKEK